MKRSGGEASSMRQAPVVICVLFAVLPGLAGTNPHRAAPAAVLNQRGVGGRAAIPYV